MTEWKGYSDDIKRTFRDVLEWMDQETKKETNTYMHDNVYDEKFKDYLYMRNILINQVKDVVKYNVRRNDLAHTLKFIRQLDNEYVYNCVHIQKCVKEIKERMETEKKESITEAQN